jgi:putative tryptophan/tyrosine transport system substrate-binding protein
VEHQQETGTALPSLKRRDLLAMIGGLGLAWPLSARAQEIKGLRRIGILTPLPNNAMARPFVAAFQDGLSALGYVDGKNIAFDVRYAGGRYD